MDLSPSQLVQAFFILTSEEVIRYRKNLFTQIHEIVFHGQGGYDWETVYNMPIWLRKFTFDQINTFYSKKQQQQQEQQSKNPNQKTVIDSTGKVKAPEFLKAPTYK
jgi:hypothetical protein